MLQEHLESRRAAENAAKLAQLDNDLHGLEAELSRLNTSLWTQVLHQLHSMGPVGAHLPCKATCCVTEPLQGHVSPCSALSTCNISSTHR